MPRCCYYKYYWALLDVPHMACMSTPTHSNRLYHDTDSYPGNLGNLFLQPTAVPTTLGHTCTEDGPVKILGILDGPRGHAVLICVQCLRWYKRSSRKIQAESLQGKYKQNHCNTPVRYMYCRGWCFGCYVVRCSSRVTVSLLWLRNTSQFSLSFDPCVKGKT
jgi:hypothetical protein